MPKRGSLCNLYSQEDDDEEEEEEVKDKKEAACTSHVSKATEMVNSNK